MTWIRTISPDDADGRLRRLYERIAGPDGHVDNIMQAHSLRPPSLEGHMALYKRVLHDASSTLEPWFREAVGVYTSRLNECAYCVDHHWAGMVRAMDDPERARSLRGALLADESSDALSNRESAALGYVHTLTLDPSSIDAGRVDTLRAAGWTDGEILEINQITAYFCYANRTVLGLGVTTDGEQLGLSPGGSADPDDWSHR